jgi:OmcA/MtrC family decaheme c-type cytochrome
MRIPSVKSSAPRLVLALIIVLGSVVLISAPGPSFTKHNKAFYADPSVINFVRPGLVLAIQNATIAQDGTITTRVKITDPKGLPLDRQGVTTPGTVSLSFIAAVLPKGQTQYTSYTTRSVTSPITSVSAVQAAADSNGTFKQVEDGVYDYTFKTKAPAGFDATATHTVGVYSSRNLTEFELGTNYADATLNFVPNGAPVTEVRDVVKTASCNKCHDQLAFHGGSRRSMELCVLCHTPQTTDPDTGNTVDMKVMAHKIHMGEELPSVQAGGKYQIIGFQQSVSDWSTVAFPSQGGARNCQSCHEVGNEAATQKDHWLTAPSRAACGSCHDNVNFATGENHVNLPQISDNQCNECHQPQGELEFDASIKGAHLVEQRSTQLPGVVVDNVTVTDGAAGKHPTVSYTLKDKAGNAIDLATINRVGLVLAGPTIDYGYTDLGGGPRGYVAEDGKKGSCDGGGNCTYTFKAAIPADAKGTYSVGIEARRTATLNPGTKREIATEYGAINKVVNFSVDDSPVQPRRKVVDIAKCNGCHDFLSLHGENRNQIEQCVLCHNPSETDKVRRDVAQDPNDKALPPQGVNFAMMIHKIHTGEAMKEDGRTFTIVGFGGSHNDFSEVRYPAFSPSGAPGDRRNCDMCHVNGSQNLPLQANLHQVTDPQGLLNPVGATTSACTGCHTSTAAASHALTQTTTQLGEACSVCHSSDAQFSVDRVHAQ